MAYARPITSTRPRTKPLDTPYDPSVAAARPVTNIAPPAQPSTPTPYQATGTKGAPIPGQTVEGPPSSRVGRPSTSVTPLGPAADMLGPRVSGGPVAPNPTPSIPSTSAAPPGISPRAWQSYNEINSTISPEQWQAWDQFYDPACPPNKPYRSQKVGANNSCEETPDNCPPGLRAYGRNECRPEAEVAALAGETGGRGGGGPDGIGTGPGGTTGSGLYDTQNDFLWQALMARLQQGSRYSPSTMASLLGEQKLGAEQAAKTAREQSTSDLASRGLARSGIAADQSRQIGQAASAQVLQARNQVLRAKVDADYQDQSDTLNQMQNWLNNARQAVLQSRATEYQKQIAMAQIQLGYAQLQQQMDMLRERYAQELTTIGLGL